MVGELSIRAVNIDEVKATLNKSVDKLPKAIKRALFASGEAIRERAIEKIQRDAKTGVTYTHHLLMNKKTGNLFPARKRSKPHRASAPGEAPASDTGRLVNSIIVTRKKNGDLVLIRAGGGSVFYVVLLEFGTMLSGGREIRPRPFMRPAFEETLPGIKKAIRKALKQEIRRLKR